MAIGLQDKHTEELTKRTQIAGGYWGLQKNIIVNC